MVATGTRSTGKNFRSWRVQSSMKKNVFQLSNRNIPFERQGSSLSAPPTAEMRKPGRISASAILFACVSLIAVHAVAVRSEAQGGNTPAASLPIRDDFDTGNLNAWQMPFPEDWEILKEGSLDYLHMKRNREPGVPRRPLQFARLRGV